MAVKGIKLFDEGHYWGAHEALEAARKDERGPVHHFIKVFCRWG
jgi:hypothetical protein